MAENINGFTMEIKGVKRDGAEIHLGFESDIDAAKEFAEINYWHRYGIEKVVVVRLSDREIIYQFPY